MLIHKLGPYLSKKVGFYEFHQKIKRVNQEYHQLYQEVDFEFPRNNIIYAARRDLEGYMFGYRGCGRRTKINDIRSNPNKKVYLLPPHYWYSLKKYELSKLYLLDKYGWDQSDKMLKTRRIQQRLYEKKQEKLQQEFKRRREEQNNQSSYCILL